MADEIVRAYRGLVSVTQYGEQKMARKHLQLVWGFVGECSFGPGPGCEARQEVQVLDVMDVGNTKHHQGHGWLPKTLYSLFCSFGGSHRAIQP